jgi:hypothetical protein
MEAEAIMAKAQLAKSDARVAGKIFNILVSINASILLTILMTPSASLFLVLTVQLGALQAMAGDVAGALHAQGDTLEDHL